MKKFIRNIRPTMFAAFFLALGLLLPMIAEACPMCFSSSPFRMGLIVATWVLFPLPFILVGLLAYWVVRDSKVDP